MNSNPTICFCHAVRYSDLVEAIRNGARTLRELQMETLASTGCGGCEIEVLEILEQELDRDPSVPETPSCPEE